MKITERADAVTIEPAQPANAAILWLHGLGADGRDFVPIVPELRLAPGTAARFVFPHAPVRPVTLNAGMPMRAWYDIPSLDRGAAQDDAGVRASSAALDALIEAQIAAGIPAGRIVIAGFSQGGAIVLHTGIRSRHALAGVMALSTYLPLSWTAPVEMTPAGRALPYLMCHGRYDQILELALGKDSLAALRNLDCAVEWHDYPMAHEVCADEIDDLSAFLRARLPAPQ